MSAVLFLMGVLLVVQFRAQTANGGLNGLTTQDLTTLIANLNDRNAELRGEVADLQAQLRTLEATQLAGASNVGQLQSELQQLRLWAGLDPVYGDGVDVVISGPITAAASNEILNELRIAGAEAMAVDGVRVVPGTVVGGDPGGLSVENVALPTPFHLQAIGDPANLQAVLQRAGGVVSRIAVAQPDVTIEVGATTMTLPGTDRDLDAPDAKPQL
ncbi:MAG TPA: DUF881 domain-containing protein [Candidatus Sulfotelmatobacter sp.]|nr:DUF881 domain-containing protein [Candidatus Sulfotelmatobacter sp.]